MSVDTGGKPHLDIDVWLQNLDLPQYSLLFCKYGGVEEILWMSERDVKELGVRNGAHRAILVSSLIVLKRKYDKGNRVKSVGTLLSSRYRSSGSLVQVKEKPSNLVGKTVSYPSVLVHSAITSPVVSLKRCSSSSSSTGSSHRSSMEHSVTVETSPEDLKKALEWELGLDSRDMRSHAWYHGTIPRQRAEELMTADGGFLVRDCVSRPGDYVLTCCWKGAPLHFVINKASPAQQPQKQEPSKDAIMAAMKDEIAEFGRELGAFKEKARCAFVPPGTEAEMRVLKRDGMELEGACEELKKGVEKTNEEVHALGVLVLETFAMLEEGRTQELRNRDPRFAGLLRGRALDPGTAQRLAEVRRLRQYLEAQLAEVHARLDLDWQEHLARRKNRKLSTLPSGEAVYRAALSCRKVTAALSAEVDSLASRVKGLKLRGSRGQAHERPRWAQATSGSLTREDEVSALADTLLSANLSVVSSDAERVPSKSPKTMLSPEKQSRLAEFLSQRSPVPVRARTIDKLSESRLMSRLAVVLNRSVAKEQEREAPARAPQQETGLPTLMPAQAPAATSTLAVKPAPIPDAKGFVTAVATPKPQEGFGPGFLTSTPLSQPELVMGGIGSGVPPARTATSDQAKMPASRVIEVSLQPRPDTGAPPQLPPGVTLTPLSTTAAPPEISAAAVTNVVTKPLATRTETTITSKEAGTAAFLPTMSQPEFKFQLPGVVSGLSATTASSSPLTSIPVYSFGMPSSAPVSSTVAPPASFGFVKPTAGVTVPTTFKIGEPSTAKPGFVVVKPSTTAPGFAPLPAAASASSASSAARKQTEEVLKGS
ncbi:nuclear pore complex protein Nup214 isoform X4, partial [Ixodes scapularis]